MSDRVHDVLVIGAGPAGSTAALQMRRLGFSVLLVERKDFPRTKVCGCCLGAKALQLLEMAGLGKLLNDLKAKEISTLAVSGEKMPNVNFPVRRSMVVSRQALDAALVEHAVLEGVEFLPSAYASIVEFGSSHVEALLRKGGTTSMVRSKVVLVADGLAGNSLHKHAEFTHLSAGESRIGIGGISYRGPEFYRSGQVYMCCGREGYLGVVRLEDDSLDIAAAVEPDAMRLAGSPAGVAEKLFHHGKLPIPPDLYSIDWSGTASLSRRRESLAGRRVFVIGDSARYVEPFTGQGIAWALLSARAVTRLAQIAVNEWDDSLIWRWQHIYRRLVVRQQFSAQVAAWILKNQKLTQATAHLLGNMPLLVSQLSARINGPLTSEEISWLQP